MRATEVAAEATPEPCPAPCGDSGSIQVELHDTLGVIALAIASLLLLRALLKEHACNRALTERLEFQKKEYFPSRAMEYSPRGIHG